MFNEGKVWNQFFATHEQLASFITHGGYEQHVRRMRRRNARRREALVGATSWRDGWSDISFPSGPRHILDRSYPGSPAPLIRGALRSSHHLGVCAPATTLLSCPYGQFSAPDGHEQTSPLR